MFFNDNSSKFKKRSPPRPLDGGVPPRDGDELTLAVRFPRLSRFAQFLIQGTREVEAPSGALAGVASFGFANTATMTGAGALAAVALITFANTGVMTGAAPIAGTAAITFTNSATLSGTGTLTGTAPLVFANSGTMVGAGALTGTIPITFANSGTLLGAGALAGSSFPTFTLSGTLDQPAGALAGSALITFTNSGLLAGDGALSGSSDLLFTLSGTLDGGAVVVVAPSTPGRTIRIPWQVRGEPEDEKRARRIREGTLHEPLSVVPPPLPKPDAGYYFKESARLQAAIQRARDESAKLLAQIAALEAQRAAEALRAAERVRLERRLTLARQSLQMAQLQEAIILEQIEVIDVAYLAVVALTMTRQ